MRHNPVLDRINDSTKWVVSAAAAATVLWRRDAQAMWCLLGSVIASLLCKVILLSDFTAFRAVRYRPIRSLRTCVIPNKRLLCKVRHRCLHRCARGGGGTT